MLFRSLYNGYQYNQYLHYKDEKIFLRDLSVLKSENTNIELINKDSVYKNNTIWEVTINYNNILREYLFLKIKEKRSFKCVTPDNLINKNINNSIYEYIDNNLLDRFNFDHIDFYVKLYEISNSNSYHYDPILLFNPQWNKDVYDINNILNKTLLKYSTFNMYFFIFHLWH